MSGPAFESLVPPAPGLSDMERRAHNHAEVARVYPESGEYIEQFHDWGPNSIVIKIGGKEVNDPQLLNGLVALQDHDIYPILVHGGGVQINQKLKENGKNPDMVIHGVRVTPPDHIPYVEEAAREVNEGVVTSIERRGGRADGVHRVFSGLPDSGDSWVISGGVETDTKPITAVTEAGKIAVVAWTGKAIGGGETLNMNGDLAGGAVAIAFKAMKYVSYVKEGSVKDKQGRRISRLTRKQTSNLLLDRVIRDGMAEKARQASNLTKNGVHDVVLTNDLLGEFLTSRGTGTIFQLGD